jgi:DNA polymerase-3 subunit gamma/tau
MWPQVLDAVSRRRRVIWIVLRENAQVQHMDGNTLRLSIDNQGALQTFQRTGGADLLRESLLEVAGVAPEVEVSFSAPAPVCRTAEPSHRGGPPKHRSDPGRATRR